MAYNLLKPVQAVKDEVMSSNITSAVVEIELQDNIGIQMEWTGTAAGTFDVQISANYREDINGNVQNPGTWTSLTLSPTIAAVGSPDTAYIDLNQLSAPYIRVVYTRSSGTGVLNVNIVGKGV